MIHLCTALLVCGCFMGKASAAITHPGIYLNSAKQSQLAAKVSGSDPKYLAWKGWIDSGGGSSTDIALIFRMTGNTAYRDRAIAAINYLVTGHPERLNSYACTAAPWDFIDHQVAYAPEFMSSVSTAYDWLYNDISATDKAAWKSFLIARADCLVAYHQNKQFSPYANGFFQAIVALAQTGIALTGDDPKADTYLATARDMYVNYFVPLTRDEPGAAYYGGGVAEGTGYSIGIDLRRITEYVTLIKNATSEDLMPLAGSYFTDMPKYVMHATSPVENFKSRMFSTGDYSENTYYGSRVPYGLGGDSPVVRTFLLMLAENLTDTALAGKIRYFLNDAQYDVAARFQNEYIIDVLWHNAAAAQSAPTDLFYFAKGAGSVFMRSGWNLGDTWIGYQAGDHFAYHGHVDNNSFQIVRRGQLAIKSGNYYDSPRSDTMLDYFIRTVAANSMLVYDPAEIYTRIRANDTYNNDGGQRGSDAVTPDPFSLTEWTASQQYYEMSQILRTENTATYGYVMSDASRAYKPGKVPRFDRSLVYLRPTAEEDFVVVYDRVTSGNAGHPKRWLLHMLAEPAIGKAGGAAAGNTTSLFWNNSNAGRSQVAGHIDSTDGDIVQFDDQSGRLFSRVLLPSSHTITKVGGAGYEHYSDGANHYPTWNTSKVIWGQWRVEVEPATAATADTFLNVMMPTTTSTSVMPPASVVESAAGAAMQGAYIQGASAKWIVMFSKSGLAVTSTNYAVSGSGTVRHLLLDMTPGQQYLVTDNGISIGSFTASSAGVVEFISTLLGAGNTFQISPASAVPIPVVTLSAGQSPIAYNSQTTLTWTATNATSCAASGAWSGLKAVSGSVSTGVLHASETYMLTCTGKGGNASQSVTISVAAPT